MVSVSHVISVLDASCFFLDFFSPCFFQYDLANLFTETLLPALLAIIK